MLEKYAPRLLVHHLRDANRDAPACTRFDAALLFVDIVESTALSDEYATPSGDGAERLAALLNDYFARVIDIVLDCGGDICKVDGDAVLAAWRVTAPGALAEAAHGAARAALLLKHAFHDRRSTPLRHRIALSAGHVVFVTVHEHQDRGHYLLDGEAVRELAAPRMRGLPGQVIASDHVATLLAQRMRFLPAAGGLELVDDLAAAAPSIVAADPARGEDVDDRLRPFVPQVLVDRTTAGQADWIAEFRTLTAVHIKLPRFDTAASDVASRIQEAVRAIAGVVNPGGIPITGIVVNEKGFVVQITCGLPPYAQEDVAILAVRAAQRVDRALRALDITPAIGITTGPALCGEIGSIRRREYLSTGLVMAYSARLMQAADDEILCDEATAQAAVGHADFAPPRLLTLKGRAQPLPVRAVRGGTSPLARFPGIEGPLFGREAEFGIVLERLDQLARGGGGVIGIEGEPGAGKTHFLAHVARAARLRAMRTATTGTSHLEETTAYFAIRGLLPDLVRHEDDAADIPLPALRERLVAAVRDPDLISRVALLADVLPLDFPDPGLVPEIKGQARLDGICDLVAHIASDSPAPGPVVLIVDDAQWLDASSAHVLATLLRRSPRLLAVLAWRPLETTAATHVKALTGSAMPRLGLPRLSAAATGAILRERLGSIDVPASLVQFIHERSEGLPFHAEQLLFSLRDHGWLHLEDGRCAVDTARVPELDVPDSLRGLILSRIDRLPPERQLTIKVASAVGRIIDPETVHRVHPLGIAPDAVEASLEALAEAGFLDHTVEHGRAAYAFRHGIIQGVTYDLLPYAQRRPLHRSIARYLEEKHAGALSLQHAVLARHWEHAGEAARAVGFRLDAADVAARRFASADALSHLDRIDRLAAQFGVELAQRDLARCARIRADACQELTRFDEAHRHYRRLAELEGIAVPRTRSQEIAAIGQEGVVQILRRAGIVRTRSEAAARDRDSLAAHIYMRFAERAYFTNDTLGLAHGTLASLNRAERAGALPEIVNASGGLALGLAAFGFLHWGAYYRERSIDLANRAGSASARGFAELLACVQSFHTGEWERMHQHGTRGAAIWARLGDRYRHQACLVLVAYRHLAIGSYGPAADALAAFGDDAQDIDSVQVRAWALAASALLDLVVRRAPQRAIGRMATAAAPGTLNPAERLLCNGIAAAAFIEAGETVSALHAAEAGLEDIARGSPAMAGALLFSVPSIAEALLVLLRDPVRAGRPREELLTLCTVASRATQRFAARNRICRPRASLVRGHLAGVEGKLRHQVQSYLEALAQASGLGLPLEEAMSHHALARTHASELERRIHLREERAILSRLGVSWSPWEQLHA